MATQLARSMVANLGTGESIGRVAIGQKSGEVFLGRDFTKMQEVSPATLEAVDREVRTLLGHAETAAIDILTANRGLVERVATTLYEVETLSRPMLDELLAQVRPVAPHRTNAGGGSAQPPRPPSRAVSSRGH